MSSERLEAGKGHSLGKIDPESGVRLLGDTVPWADGKEDVVLDFLQSAVDRTVASDELAAHITDWPTRYHFSRVRANLLRPFVIGPGIRVLDVGAGSGTATRYLGDQGAHVVALEGSLSRARSAAARCRDLPNVEVVCGPLSDLQDTAGFDLIVCIGVYEHVAGGGAAEAAAFLASLRALLRPHGALLLAIENQLGLKYLLGYGEDHTNEPWLGIEGYTGSPPAVTFSRAALSDNLTDAGFPAQRFYYPFPDYKMPRVVLDESAYARPNTVDFVDQLIRWPCSSDASTPLRLVDDRRAHRVFLEAGLGQQVANSFLVLASATDAALVSYTDQSVRAWHFGNDRQRRFLGVKEVKVEPNLAIETAPFAENEQPVEGWLRQVRTTDAPFIVGRTVEQDALRAAGLGMEALERVLRDWRQQLRALEFDTDDAEDDHPFRTPETRRFLPEEYIDVCLSNFIANDDGLHYVDSEWHASGPVDADLVVVRALWYFAADLTRKGVHHPWSANITVDEMTARLGGLSETPADDALLSRWKTAESDMQAKIHGCSAAGVRTELDSIGLSTRSTGATSQNLPFTALRQLASDLQAHLAELNERVVERDTLIAARDAEVRALRASTSWRVTSPLRALSGIVLRTRGATHR
ncbi:MAG: class I SAM-dependent methyltransferase [Ilumatobacteraceae bacterium]